ncbi:MAG: class I SAM-dependent methyltransferase [Candidatus Helarchaeota archaeon]
MHLGFGMIVVELGPGKGFYTITIAKELELGGILYAFDIKKKIIELSQKRIEKEQITNTNARIGNAYALPFDDESVDCLFAICCLLESPEIVRALRECYRILKNDGLLSLCEWFPDTHYPRRKTVKRWAEEAGFELKEEFGN